MRGRKKLPVAEERAALIISTKRAACALTERSESLRAALDDLDTKLRSVAELGCIDQATWEPLAERLDRIRKARNSMECFETQLRVNEVMEQAWRQLP